MKFLTGGKPREAAYSSLNRFDSGGDSKVWMEEFYIFYPEVFIRSLFYFEAKEKTRK